MKKINQADKHWDVDGIRFVSVFKSRNLQDGSWETASINWTAKGSVDPETAALCLNVMKKAINYSKGIDKKYPKGSDPWTP